MGQIDDIGNSMIRVANDFENLSATDQESVMDYLEANDSKFDYVIEDIEDEEIPDGMSLPDWMWRVLGYKRVGQQAKKHTITRRA